MNGTYAAEGERTSNRIDGAKRKRTISTAPENIGSYSLLVQLFVRTFDFEKKENICVSREMFKLFRKRLKIHV